MRYQPISKQTAMVKKLAPKGFALLVYIASFSLYNHTMAQGGQKWASNGNSASTGDFIGTTNNFPLVFKTNSTTRMQLTSSGFLGIGTTSPLFHLDVNGNANVSGTSAVGGNLTVGGTLNVTGALVTNSNITAACVSTACLNVAGSFSSDILTATNKITASKIVSPTGEIAFGDSTLKIIGNLGKIYNDEFGGVRGISIGKGVGSGTGGTRAMGANSTAIGYNVRTDVNANNSVIIGSSHATGSSTAMATIAQPNSFWLGFNSDIPTLFVTPASGAGTTGNVGVGTITPQKQLHVNGTGRFANSNGFMDVEFNSAHGILNSSHDILINFYSQKDVYVGPGKLEASGLFQSLGNTYLAVGSGNVGVGITNATKKLDVAGDVNASNYFINGIPLPLTQWQDVANGIKYNGNKVGIGFDPNSLSATCCAPLSQERLFVKGYGRFTSNSDSSLCLIIGNDGANGVIDNHTSTPNDTSSLLINYYSGNNVYINTGTNKRGNTHVGGLFYGDSTAFFQQKVSIGVAPNNMPPRFRLYVADGILAERVKVAIEGSQEWSDYVFDKNYKLMPLNEVENFISKNKHLPGVPSANDMVNEGLDVAKMDATLLQKIEELTLYMLEMKKENETLKQKVELIEKTRKQ